MKLVIIGNFALCPLCKSLHNGHNVKLFVMESFKSLPLSEYTFVFNSFHNISLCLTKFFEPGY